MSVKPSRDTSPVPAFTVNDADWVSRPPCGVVAADFSAMTGMLGVKLAFDPPERTAPPEDRLATFWMQYAAFAAVPPAFTSAATNAFLSSTVR